MMLRNEIEKMVIELRQCAWYPKGCSTCPEPERCKEIISHATTRILELVEKCVPEEEALLTLMLNKIPAKYHNNPDKISEFGDIFEDIIQNIITEIKRRIGMKITPADVWEHKPCQPEWPMERLEKVLGEGKTLLEILDLQEVKVRDRIWCVTRFLPDKVNRAFAIWCARRCKPDCKEITKYINTIERYYNGKATKEELQVAYWAAYGVAYWVADEAADGVAYWVAFGAAYWVADGMAERQKQIEKLKEMIGCQTKLSK